MEKVKVMDTERCSGCLSCMFACTRKNREKVSLEKSAIQIRSTGGIEKGFAVVMCRDCEDPPCAEVCETGALKPKEDGGVSYDEEKCTGCGLCEEACTVNAIVWDEDSESPIICDNCGYCVQFCPHDVLSLESTGGGG